MALTYREKLLIAAAPFYAAAIRDGVEDDRPREAIIRDAIEDGVDLVDSIDEAEIEAFGPDAQVGLNEEINRTEKP